MGGNITWKGQLWDNPIFHFLVSQTNWKFVLLNLLCLPMSMLNCTSPHLVPIYFQENHQRYLTKLPVTWLPVTWLPIAAHLSCILSDVNLTYYRLLICLVMIIILSDFICFGQNKCYWFIPLVYTGWWLSNYWKLLIMEYTNVQVWCSLLSR